MRLLSLNLFCSFAAVRARVALVDFNKDFFNALQEFNRAALTTSLLHFVVIVIIMILAFGYSSYFNGLLSIRWRRWLTRNYLHKWLENHTHYRMQLNTVNVDNPDQRISEDLDSFPTLTLSITLLLFESILSFTSFGYILWNLSSSLAIPYWNGYLHVPGYLFWGALFYGIIGAALTGWIGKRLASYDYDQQRYNADFRFSLVRLRESSEQIAMYNGELIEDSKCNDLFSHIYNNYLKINSLNKWLSSFANGYSVTSFLIGIFMAIPLYLSKKIQLGGMMQISGAFSSVVGAFSRLIYSFNMFAQWKAVIYRLSEFNQSIKLTKSTESNVAINTHDIDGITINHLTLLTPDGTPLLNNLNLTFLANTSYLLTGKSGLGKSTLLRAIAGLCQQGDGEINLPRNKSMLFIPQKPYLPLGSLRDILFYPDANMLSDASLIQALQHSGLARLESRLDEIKNWSLELSLGEQQLIGFARVFLKNPDIIFLDEATSALDERTEALMYGKLKSLLPQATIISVAHRSTLHKYHENIIQLTRLEELNCQQLALAGETLSSRKVPQALVRDLLPSARQ